ncbi:MAG: dihydroorotase [Planctomycetota bacterium]|jgi:dihydroorotase
MSDILLISNARIVNEGMIIEGDVLVEDGRIRAVGGDLAARADGATVIDAAGRHLLPGLIDDQVHFREPGLTHKGDLAHEARAAVAGGITSFMEMPNTNPPAITIDAVEAKYARAAEVSVANYAFYLGASNDNIDQVRALDPSTVAGIKAFMGASTGNMLVNKRDVLDALFAEAPCLITTHCEDTPMIQAAEAAAHARFGEVIPIEQHPIIRSREACYASSSLAVELAKQHGARLHVLHLTTAEEMALFEPGPVEGKRITAEACVHHLWFTDASYATQGREIKCNPAVKTAADRAALRQALIDGRIDVLATDHAPHTRDEKNMPGCSAPSGLPYIQHALPMLLDLVHQGVFTLELIADRYAHNVARLFQVRERGFIREGYHADLTLIDLDATTTVRNADILSKCAWSPLDGQTLRGRVDATIVNGRIAYRAGQIVDGVRGERLAFDR